MVTPVLELIRAALNVNNILIDGEDPSADDAKATLFQLNSMLDSWNADNPDPLHGAKRLSPRFRSRRLTSQDRRAIS